MARQSELRVVISGDTSQLHRALKRADKDVSGFGKQTSLQARVATGGFRRIGVAATGMAAAIGGVAAVGAKVVNITSDINESLTKNEALFGRNAAAIDKFSKTTARSLGISRREALAAAGSFGGLFDALNIGQRESAGMSKRLVTLAADLASFNNASPEEALQALRSGLSGESEPLRRFNAFLSEARVKAEAYRSGIARTGAELTEQQKVQARYNLILRDTQAAQGDAIKTGDGFANSQRRLRATVEDLGARVGAVLIPAATKATQALATFVGQIDSGRGAGGQFRRIVIGIGEAIGAVVTPLVAFGKAFHEGRPAAVALGAAIAGVTAGLITFKAAVAISAVVGAATAAVGGLSGAFLGLAVAIRANPLTAAVTAIAAVGTAVVVAYKKSETFRNIVNGAFRAISRTAGDMGATILRVIDRILGGYSSLASAAGKLPGPLGAPFRSAAKAIDGAREKLRGTADELDRVGEKARKPVKIRVSVVADSVEDFVGNVRNALGKLGGDGIGRGPLPRGGGPASLKGANSALAPFAGIASRFRLGVSSGLRPGSITSSGNTSYHSSGEAIDVAGPPAGMLGFFRLMKSRYGGRLAELIYTPGGVGVKNGRPHRYSGRVAADHYDHVHLAVDLGRPGIGDGYGAPRLADLWQKAGGPKSSAVVAAAIALAESGGRPNAVNRNRDGSIDRGLWQINSVHGALSTFSPTANARAAVKISKRGRDFSPWVAYTSGAYRRFLAAARRGASGRGGGRAAVPTVTGGFGATGRAGRGITGPDAATAGGFAQIVANTDVRLAEAARVPGNAGETQALTTRRAAITTRLGKVTRALKGTLRPETRLRLTQERAQLLGDLGTVNTQLGNLRAGRGIDEAAPEAAAPLTADEMRAAASQARRRTADLAVRRAGLTEGLQDDLTASRDVTGALFKDWREAAERFGEHSIEAAEALTELEEAGKRTTEILAEIAQREREAMLNRYREGITGLEDELIRAQVDTAGDLSDDLGVLRQQLAAATQAYQDAVARGDAEAIKEFGQNVLSLRGSVDGLTEEMSRATETAQRQLELTREMLAEARRAAAIASTNEGTLSRALADSLSNQIVGRGLVPRASMPATGVVARY